MALPLLAQAGIGLGTSLLGGMLGGGQKSSSGGLPKWYTDDIVKKQIGKPLTPIIGQQVQQLIGMEPQRQALTGGIAGLIPSMTATDLGAGAYNRNLAAGYGALNAAMPSLRASGVNPGALQSIKAGVVGKAAEKGAAESAAQQDPAQMAARLMQAMQLLQMLQQVPAAQLVGQYVTASNPSVSAGNPIGNGLIAAGGGMLGGVKWEDIFK